MRIFEINRVYPFEHGPKIWTKPNLFGRTFPFTVSAFSVTKRRVKVYGQTEHGVWCHYSFKYKNVPGWLKRGMKIGRVSSKV